MFVVKCYTKSVHDMHFEILISNYLPLIVSSSGLHNELNACLKGTVITTHSTFKDISCVTNIRLTESRITTDIDFGNIEKMCVKEKQSIKCQYIIHTLVLFFSTNSSAIPSLVF